MKLKTTKEQLEIAKQLITGYEEGAPLQVEFMHRLVADAEAAHDLHAALSYLCKELQCPAMEYLNASIQKAWSEAFNLVEEEV